MVALDIEFERIYCAIGEDFNLAVHERRKRKHRRYGSVKTSDASKSTREREKKDPCPCACVDPIFTVK